MTVISIQATFAATLEEEMNNLVGPKQQYNTMLSPAYLRNNTSEESISPQSGNITLAQTDYVLPGVNGLDLEIKRIYSSGTANVRDMKAEYVNGVWVDQVYTDNNISSFYEDRYDLGIGMRFSFPSMEIKQNADGSSYKFLHTEAGDVYTLKGPEKVDNINTYMPDNQTIKDVTIKENKEFSNGQTDGTSFYVMTNKMGKKTYFAEDGRVLGIVDRYGNKITFQYTTKTYTTDRSTKTKKLITKITDTMGREVKLEYKEDQNFTVGEIENKTYSIEDSYKATQNPNTTDSGDLKEKFQVIMTLPEGKKIIYDKSAVLVSDSKHVIRTRLQRVYDVDGNPKYHYWYDQPELGFTFSNGTTYSAFNRYENLTQIDYCKTNRLERFTYESYKKKLTNNGSMQYRKIFDKKELAKIGYDATKSFLDAFTLEVKDMIIYKYTNEADGYGFSGYFEKNDSYLKDTYRYYTEKTESNGTITKYTYNGIHEQISTEETGSDHKMVSVIEYDEMKFPKKTEKTTSSIENGQVKGQPVKKIENYRYDMYGNLTNYTGPIANRDDNGYPKDDENTVVYTYAYDKFHVLAQKTWKQDKDTKSQIIYSIDDKGNVIKEERVHTSDKNSYLVTDYEYDKYGNITKKTVHSTENDYVTNYEYGSDANGVDQKGAYLTKQYSTVNGVEISKKFAYDFNTGNMKAELDGKDNKIGYEYDTLSRLSKISYPDNTLKQYTYNDYKNQNRQIEYTDPAGVKFQYTYDIFGNQVSYCVFDKAVWQTLIKDEYDSQGNKTKEIDSNGNSTRFTYNSENMLVKKEYYEKDGTKKENLSLKYIYGFDAETQLLLTLTDEDGYEKRLHYDITGKLIKSEETPDKSKYYSTFYEYNYVGNLLSQIDNKGNKTKYTYDDLGRLVSKKDALNNETKYTYNSIDKPTIIEEPENRTTQYIYDTAGRTSEERVYDKASPKNYVYKKYTYDKSNNLETLTQGKVEGSTDSVSSYVKYSNNNMDRVTDEFSKIDASTNAHTNYTYDNKGNIACKTEYINQSGSSTIKHNYEYDYADRVVKQEGVMSDKPSATQTVEHGHYINKFSYDYAGNRISEEQYNGTGFDKTTYKYDYRNRLVQKLEPFTRNGAIKTKEYAYDKRGNLASETLIRSNAKCITQYIYNGIGKITTKTDPMGYVTKYIYDENGNLTKEIDPRYSSQDISAAPCTEYEYDTLNRPIKVSVFDGTSKTVISYKEYDGRGNVIKEAVGEGYNKNKPSESTGNTYEYDAANNVTRYISAQKAKDNKQNGTDNYTKKYTYDGSNRVLTENDPYGNVTKNVYLLNGLLKQKTYADTSSENFEYDLTGKNISTEKDKAKNKTTTYTNLFGKAYRIEYPDNTAETFEYSPKGELIKSVDKAGNAKYFDYDLLGNLTDKKEYISSNNTTNYYKLSKSTYDETGNLLSTETFEYIVSKGSQTAGVEKSTGDRVEYSYDLNGRTTKISGPAGHETINEYDKKGNLITQKQKTTEKDYQVTRYEYDVQSRPIVQALLVETSEIENNYLRDVQFDSEYTTKVKAKTTYTYYDNGQLKTQTDANGNTTAFEYDLDKKPIKKTDALKKTTSYVYDLNGNLQEERNAKGISTYYEYDSMNRLIRKKAPASDRGQAVTRYIYDVMGNLKKQIQPNSYGADKDTAKLAETMQGISYTYDTMNRRLSTILPEGSTLEYLKYDANGNIVKKVDGLRFKDSIETSPGTCYLYDGLGRATQITDVLGSRKSFEYSVLGNISKTTNERNNSTLYEYNTDGTLAKVTFADGGQIEYTYDMLGRKTNQKDQLGNTTTYSYNSFGNVKNEKDAYDNTLEYKADLIGNIVAAKDKRDSITYITYDAANRPVKKKLPLELDGSGNVLYSIENYTYDELGNITAKEITGTKDKLSSRTTSYTYYDNNQVNTVTDSSGAFARSYYDKNGNTVKIERLRAEGIYDIQKLEYDSMNRLIKDIKLVDEEDIYNSASLPAIEQLRDVEYPDKLRMITAYEYDILGNKTKVTSPFAFGYKEVDTSNRYNYTTVYSYDLLNRIEKVTRKYNGRDVSTQYTYDTAGNNLTEKNERGFETSYTYDKLNRVESTTDALKNLYKITYDLAGNKLSETNTKGDTMTYGYDKLNRLVTVTDAYSKVISRKVYDNNGNIIKEIDAKGYLSADNDEARYGTLYTYNLANLLTTKTTPEAAAKDKYSIKYNYNQYCEVVKQTDSLENATAYEYDAAGRLTKVTDALGIATKYSYDKQGNKLTMTDGRGKLTRYSYTAFGMLKTVINPDSKAITYKYDLLGNTACVTDKNGNHTVYTYDNIGLLLERKVTETGDSISYTYDEAGNRISMEDESGTSIYTYDENNRLLEIQRGNSVQISYAYDQVGNVTKVTDLKGNAVAYTYDKSNRMETVSNAGKTTTYTYDENGRRASIDYEGGVSEQYTYDKDNQLINLANKKPNGSIISEYSYTYDLAGRQLSKTDSYGTTNYEYDKAGRITKVITPGKTTVYAYDKAGNRLSLNETYMSLQPSEYVDESTGKDIQYILKKSDYSYSNSNTLIKLIERMFDKNNKEIARKTTKYVYDDNGNQLRQSVSHVIPDNTKLRPSTTGTAYGDNVSGGINKLVEKTSYTYDGFNRLKKTETVKEGVRITAEYTYNGDDLRVSKTVKKSDKGYIAEVTNYLYDRQNVILETDASNNIKARYIKGINYIAKTDSKGTLSYFLFNGHGDVVQTVDEAGTVQNQYDYDIWGNPVLTVETTENAIRYSGEFMDSETGLYYLRARYYDPYVGRFTTEDSNWGEDTNPLNLNLYTYCENDPIRYTDPSGHAVTEWDKQHLSKGDIKQLEKLGNDWNAAKKGGNQAGKDSAHAAAEALRDKYRNDNEVGTADGHTVTRTSGSGGSGSSSSDSSSGSSGSSFGPSSGGGAGPKLQDDIAIIVGKDRYVESITLDERVKEISNYGTIGNLITMDNSNVTMNNYNIIYTLTTGKSSSLVLNNFGQTDNVTIGENGTAIIKNSGKIGNVTGGDITDGTEKGMYIENRGTIEYVLTGSNSHNIIDNDGGKLTLETGKGNETIVVEGHKGVSISGGNGKLFYRLYKPGLQPQDIDATSKNLKEIIKTLIHDGWSFNKPVTPTSDVSFISLDLDNLSGDAKKEIQRWLDDIAIIERDKGIYGPTGLIKYVGYEEAMLAALNNLDVALEYINSDLFNFECRLRSAATGTVQVVGGITEAGTGAALFTGTSWTGIGIPVGLAGGYMAIDGASNVTGGASKVYNSIFGNNEGDTLNFMKTAYKKLSPKYGEDIYNLTQLGIGIYSIGSGLKQLPSDSVKVFSRPKNITRAKTEGLTTSTVVLDIGNQVVVTTKTESGMILQKMVVDKSKVKSGALLIGVDVQGVDSAKKDLD